MSRTPIAANLIHNPEEVDSNGRRFDYLCRITEEVAFPVVRQALFREFEETTATGAEILSDESKQALLTIAEDAAILEDLDEEKVLSDLKKSLDAALPPPGEEECLQHTRDFTQVLMSTWLETLIKAHTPDRLLELSEFLLPEQGSVTKFVQRRLGTKNKLPENIADAVISFAPDQEDIFTLLKTLKEKLFDRPRLVDLPFDLAMLGAPAIPGYPARVMVMKRDLFLNLLREMENQQLREIDDQRKERERLRDETIELTTVLNFGHDRWTIPAAAGLPELDSSTAQRAAANVSVPLPQSRYQFFASIPSAQLKPNKIERAVRKARAAATATP